MQQSTLLPNSSGTSEITSCFTLDVCCQLLEVYFVGMTKLCLFYESLLEKTFYTVQTFME